MQLAGIPIRDEDMFKLARLLRADGFEHVADKLTHALLVKAKVLALTVIDRESILWALDEPPTDALAGAARRARARARMAGARGARLGPKKS